MPTNRQSILLCPQTGKAAKSNNHNKISRQKQLIAKIAKIAVTDTFPLLNDLSSSQEMS